MIDEQNRNKLSRFEDKVVVVVGATSGIGESAAIEFAAEGAEVIVAGRRQEKGEAVVARIRERGGRATFAPVDVRAADSISELILGTENRFGRLDVAFNNAGIPGEYAKRTDEQNESSWDDVIETNLKGVWLCMKHELAAMARCGAGAIVNTASIYGAIGSGYGIAPYIASKHGILGLTRAAAIEYAKAGIRINAVSPGFTRTEITEPALRAAPEEFARGIDYHVPMGRLAEPREIARAVLWLCSNEASFATGTTLVVDGGWLAK